MSTSDVDDELLDSDTDNEESDHSIESDGPHYKFSKYEYEGDKTKTIRRFSGAAVYNSKFQSSWTEKWPFIMCVKENPNSFRCSLCLKTLSCSHQGERDVTRHISSAQHTKNAKSFKNMVPLSSSGKNIIKNKVCK